MSEFQPHDLPEDATTIVEPRFQDDGFDATVLEQGAGQTNQHNQPETSIRVGSLFLDCRVVEPLRVTSAEADLWILQKDTIKFILKHYRFGIEPKSSVTAAIAQSGATRIVKSFNTGKHDGRFYEIQEYIENGSLAELISRGIQQDSIRDIIREICEAIKSLHALKIIHRDIKPSNILVRSLTPLNLVLSDFGISSLADLSLHHTSANRTAGYSAPEALTGNVKFASDWWSVGVILLEMLSGKHPLSGVSETAINYQLATRGIVVDETVPLEWQPPVKGLLTRDPEQRWGGKELLLWLDGHEDIPVFYTEAHFKGNSLYDYLPYKFEGKELYILSDLAVALAENWNEGVKRLGRGSILEWVKNDLKNHDLAAQLEDITEDNRLDADSRLTVALLVIAKELPLVWKGQPIVDNKWLENNPDQAAALCDTAVGEWVAKIHKDNWLLEWASYRRSILSELQVLQKEAGFKDASLFDPQEIDRLVFAPERAKEVATGIMSSYTGATIPRIEAILKSGQASPSEEIALALCKRSIFLTQRQEAARTLTISIKEIVNKGLSSTVSLDDTIIARLATGEQYQSLLPVFQKIKSLVISYDNPNLDRILNAEKVYYIDLAVIAATEGARCRVAFETLRQFESPYWEEFLTASFKEIEGGFPLPNLDFHALCPCCGEVIKSTLIVCSKCHINLASYSEAVCQKPATPNICTAQKKERRGSFQCPQCSTHYTVPVRGFLWSKKQTAPKHCMRCGLAFPTKCTSCRTSLNKITEKCSKCKKTVFKDVCSHLKEQISFYVAVNESHTATVLKTNTDKIIEDNLFGNLNITLNRILNNTNADESFYNAVTALIESFSYTPYRNKIDAEKNRLMEASDHLISSSVLSEIIFPCSTTARLKSTEVSNRISATNRNPIHDAVSAIYMAKIKRLDSMSAQIEALRTNMPRLKSIIMPDVGGSILKFGAAAGVFALGCLLGNPLIGLGAAGNVANSGNSDSSNRDFIKLIYNNLNFISDLAEKDTKSLQPLTQKFTAAVNGAMLHRCRDETAFLLHSSDSQTS